MKWISVKDRLPDKYIDILVFDGINIYTASYKEGYETSNLFDINKGIFFYSNAFGEYIGGHECDEWAIPVTHWMPLPKPPKE